MEQSNRHRAYAAELMASLDDDHLSLVDFDRLKMWLAEIGPRLESLDSVRTDLELLRRDYIGRIGGMVKAIAVADRKGNRYESALALIDSLESMPTSDLIDCYRKTCARFRDCFPASFGGPMEFRRAPGRPKELSDYK